MVKIQDKDERLGIRRYRNGSVQVDGGKTSLRGWSGPVWECWWKQREGVQERESVQLPGNLMDEAIPWRDCVMGMWDLMILKAWMKARGTLMVFIATGGSYGSGRMRCCWSGRSLSSIWCTRRGMGRWLFSVCGENRNTDDLSWPVMCLCTRIGSLMCWSPSPLQPYWLSEEHAGCVRKAITISFVLFTFREKSYVHSTWPSRSPHSCCLSRFRCVIYKLNERVELCFIL